MKIAKQRWFAIGRCADENRQNGVVFSEHNPPTMGGFARKYHVVFIRADWYTTSRLSSFVCGILFERLFLLKNPIHFQRKKTPSTCTTILRSYAVFRYFGFYEVMRFSGVFIVHIDGARFWTDLECCLCIMDHSTIKPR